MCFGCSKEPSHRDGSFEYPQHMFWLRNKKNNFVTHSYMGTDIFLSKMYMKVKTIMFQTHQRMLKVSAVL